MMKLLLICILYISIVSSLIWTDCPGWDLEKNDFVLDLRKNAGKKNILFEWFPKTNDVNCNADRFHYYDGNDFVVGDASLTTESQTTSKGTRCVLKYNKLKDAIGPWDLHRTLSDFGGKILFQYSVDEKEDGTTPEGMLTCGLIFELGDLKNSTYTISDEELSKKPKTSILSKIPFLGWLMGHDSKTSSDKDIPKQSGKPLMANGGDSTQTSADKDIPKQGRPRMVDSQSEGPRTSADKFPTRGVDKREVDSYSFLSTISTKNSFSELNSFDEGIPVGKEKEPTPTGKCSFWPSVMHAPLRNILKRVVGKPSCTLYGTYEGFSKDGSRISLTVGQLSHILYNKESGEMIAGHSLSTQGLFVVGPEVCYSTGPNPSPFCSKCESSSGKYVVHDYGGSCDSVELEVIQESCSERMSLLEGRFSLRRYETISSSCPNLPVSGEELTGSLGEASFGLQKAIVPGVWLFGPGDLLLISSSFGNAFSLNVLQWTLLDRSSPSFQNIAQLNSITGEIVMVREISALKGIGDEHIGFGCLKESVGFYLIDCSSFSLSLLYDDCGERINALNGAILGSRPNIERQSHSDYSTNAGFGFDEWIAVVDRDGTVCDVVYSGDEHDSQWPGSRVIAAQKATTANAFSLPDFSIGTTHLYTQTQPGWPMWGLQFSNPMDASEIYPKNEIEATMIGTVDDPLIGKVIGGTCVFGGGLALYDATGKILGGIGASGDTSCADHFIAWRVRHLLGLDFVPNGPNMDSGDDGIIFSTKHPWGQPHCVNISAEKVVQKLVHPTSKVGELRDIADSVGASRWLRIVTDGQYFPEWAHQFFDLFWNLSDHKE